VEDLAGHELVADSPLEGVADAVDLIVDVSTAPAHLDHPLPHGLERPRAELGGSRFGVELLERPEGQAELLDLLDAAIGLGAVVLLGMSPEAGEDFLDFDGGRLDRELPAGSEPFGDNLVVPLLGFGGAVLAKLDGLAVENRVGLAGGLVMT